jgi:hypothetical protein
MYYYILASVLLLEIFIILLLLSTILIVLLYSIIGGRDSSIIYNDVTVSTDGIIWTVLTSAASYQKVFYTAAVVWKDTILIAGNQNIYLVISYTTLTKPIIFYYCVCKFCCC